MALYTGLTNEFKISKILALSSWLPLQNKIKIVQRPSIFQGHGNKDDMISLKRAQKTADFLGIKLKVYDIGHVVAEETFDDIYWFLLK